MQTELIILILAAASFIAVGYAGTRQSEVRPTTSLGWFRIGAGLAMAYVGGAATIAMAGIGYANGAGGWLDPFSVFLGGIIALFGIRRASLPTAGQGIAEFLANGDPVRTRVYAGCSLAVYILLASAQVVALGKVFEQFVGINEAQIVAIAMFLAIVGYVYRGGIVAVTRTDIVQFLVVCALFVIPGLVGVAIIFRAEGGTPITQTPLDLRTALLLTLSVFFVPLSQDVWIRVRRAKSVAAARSGVLLGVTLYAVIVSLAVGIGMMSAQRGIVVSTSEAVLPAFFTDQLGLAGVVPTIVLLAAIMSTLDSFTYNLTSTFSSEAWPKRWSAISLESRLRIAAVVTFAICSGIALFAQSILSLVLTALMLYVSVIGPGIIARNYLKAPMSVWFPALVTLVVIATSAAAQIKWPYEPYSYLVFHFALLAVFGVGEAIERSGAGRSKK